MVNIELIKKFNTVIPDEQSARNYVFNILYGSNMKKIICVKCGASGKHTLRENERLLFKCGKCKYRHIIRNHTFMDKIKFEIRNFLLVYFLYLNNKGGISTQDIMLHIQEGSKRSSPAKIWNALTHIKKAEENNDKILKAISEIV